MKYTFYLLLVCSIFSFRAQGQSYTFSYDASNVWNMAYKGELNNKPWFATEGLQYYNYALRWCPNYKGGAWTLSYSDFTCDDPLWYNLSNKPYPPDKSDGGWISLYGRELYGLSLFPTGTISAFSPFTNVYGTASASQSFTYSITGAVSSAYLVAKGVMEVSLDNVNFYSSISLTPAYKITGTAYTRVNAANSAFYTMANTYSSVSVSSDQYGNSGGSSTTVYTISPKPITITATDPAKKYGTALTATNNATGYTIAGLVGNNNITSVRITPDAAGLSATTAASASYKVTPSAFTSSNYFDSYDYVVTYIPFNGTVGKRNLAITATGTSKSYGVALSAASGTNFTATGLYGTETISSVTLTPSANATSATAAVGTNYTLNASNPVGTNGFAESNYNISYTPFNGTIVKSNLTITANPPTKTFGTALNLGQNTSYFTVSGSLAPTESVASVLFTADAAASSATTAAGAAYSIGVSNAVGSGSFAQSNYNITYVPYNGNVVKANLSITAPAVLKTYGTALTGSSAAPASVTGLVNSNTVTSVTLTPDATGTQANAAAGSSYLITPSNVLGANGFQESNYNISYIAYTGTIAKKALSVTATGPLKTYGTALPDANGNTFIASGMVGTENVNRVKLSPDAPGSAATTAAGAPYTITPSLATGTNGFLESNYQVSYNTYNGTVAKAALTVTATGPSKTYGMALTTGPATSNFISTGTVNGESLSEVTLVPDAAGLLATTAAGTGYVVSPTAVNGTGSFSTGNYQITYIPFNGTVAKKTLTVTATGPQKEYGTALTAGDSNSNFTATGTAGTELVSQVRLTPDANGLSAATAALSNYSVMPSQAIGSNGFMESNYAVTYVPYSGAISKKALIVTATGPGKIYGTALTAGNSTTNFTATGMAGSESVSQVRLTPDANGLSASTAALSNYTVTPSLALGMGGFQESNYAVTYVPFSSTVAKAALTLTATGPLKTYGTALIAANGTNFTAGATANGEIISQVLLSPDANGISSTTPALSTYTVTPSLASGAGFLESNYTINYIPYTGTVAQKSLTVSATGPAKTYGTALTTGNSTNNFTATGMVTGEEVTQVMLNPDAAGLNAFKPATSPYVVSPSGAIGTGGFLAGNYLVNYVAFNGTVAKKDLTITATGPVKIYGTAIATGYSNTNFEALGMVAAEQVNSVYFSPDAAAAAATTPAGSAYTVTPSAAVGSNGFMESNYQVNYVPYHGTLGKKNLIVTATGPAKTYGTALRTGLSAVNFTVSGLTGTEEITNVYFAQDAAGLSPTTAAGAAYVSTPTASTGIKGFDENNYQVQYIPYTGTVAQKALTLRATGPEKIYGTALQTVRSSNYFNVTGLANNETVTEITLTPDAGAASALTGAEAAYVVTPSMATGAGGFMEANYALNYVAYSGTVAKKDLQITANSISKTYGEAITFLGSEFTSVGLANGDVVEGVTLTSAGALATATVAGSAYPIAAVNASGNAMTNYNIGYTSGTLSVNTKTLTVLNLDRAKIYGSSLTDADFDGSITGIVNQDRITLTRSSTGQANTAVVGDYPILATLNDPDGKLPNYRLTHIPANLTVNPKALTVTAHAQTKTYGDVFTFSGTEFSSSGLVNGNTITKVSLSSLGAAATAPVAGQPFAITPAAAIGSGLENYAITYLNADLTLLKKDLTVSNNSRAKTYGTPLSDPDFTGSLTGIKNQDNIRVLRMSDGAAATAAANNTYPIHAILLDPDQKLGNYNLSNLDGTLNVGLKKLTIAANDQTKTYGTLIKPTGKEFTTTGLVNTDQVNLVQLSSTGFAANAGLSGSAYTISANAATGTGLSNYAINYLDGSLILNKKTLTIKADNQEKFIGTANPLLTATYSGFVNNEGPQNLSTPVVLTTPVVQRSPIGAYTIAIAGGNSSNYEVHLENGVFKVKPGEPTSITLTKVTLFENSNAGTAAGNLSSTANDPAAQFTYTLVAGNGDTDNGAFMISEDAVYTTRALDFEAKPVYSIRIRSTTQYGFSTDQVFSMALTDVNEQPTADAIANATICYTSSLQNIPVRGITSGPEPGQIISLSISSSNNDLFSALGVNNNGNAGTISYRIKDGASGSAVITLTVKDNGGTANGGVDTFTRSFTITVNSLPVISISSDKGSQISKGEIAKLTAHGGSSYVWMANSSILSGQNTATLTIRPQSSTLYTVTALNTLGCSTTQSFSLAVDEDFAKIKPNNILTPNGDGVNDRWIVDNIDFYPNNEVKVFDKNSRILYRKKKYDNTWDGTFNGEPLAEGTYYYVIVFGTDKLNLMGYITILRNN